MFPASSPVAAGAPGERFRLRSAVRVRKSTKTEGAVCVTAEDAGSVRAVYPENDHVYEFAFDAVLGPEATQDDAYERLLAPLMADFLYGVTENTCVMAYGQTGAGKSHTIDGLLRRAAAELFDGAGQGPALVRVRYVNIYNERITDLLRWVRRQPPESARDRHQWRTNLRIRETPARRVHVPDLSEHLVSSADELLALVNEGQQDAVVRATNMGATCSREHRILSLRLERPDSASTLTLVDLAGSERVRKTGATGDRLVEARSIGISLSSLGNVVAALTSGRSRHIPYRDSKITRLLQFALGGDSTALMVGHVGPCEDTFDESLSTLRFVNRVAQVRNSSSGSSTGEPMRLLQILEELELLRTELSEAVGEEAEALQGCVAALEAALV